MVIKVRLIHEDNLLLDWCVSNAYQYSNTDENIRLSKKNKDDSQHIWILRSVHEKVHKFLDDILLLLGLILFITASYSVMRFWGDVLGAVVVIDAFFTGNVIVKLQKWR